MKILNKIAGILCAAVLLFSAVPQAFAATSPTLYFSNITVYTGSSSWCYLRMKNAENIAAMNYIITYDSDNLEFANYVKQGFTSQSDVTMDINSDTPGEIHVQLVSLNGLNGTNILNALSFKAKSGAKLGEYTISVIVTDIFDMSLKTVVAEKQSGTITIKEGSPTVKSVSFSNTLSSTAVETGESFDYTLSASSLNGLSAGTFDFYYDETRLKLNEVTLSAALQKTVYDINDKTDGLVKISFVSESAITSGTNAVKLNFTAISSGTAQISFKPSSLYDSSYASMTGSELSKTVTITDPEPTVDYSDFKLVPPEEIPSDKEFSVDVVLEGGSGVRAGDFVITYDSDVLKCVDVSMQSVSGVWTTKDNTFSNGQIKFSVMSNVDLNEDTTLVSIKLKSKENTDSKSAMSISGSGVYDVNFNSVTLEYIGAEVKAVRPEYTVYFYDLGGETLLFSQKVLSGNSAIAPKIDEIKKCDKTHHLKFDGWDKDYSEISENTDFTAFYTQEAHTEVAMAETFPGIDTPGLSGGTKCAVCGEIITEQTTVSPTGAVVSAVLSNDGTLTVSGAISDSKTTENYVVMEVYDEEKFLDSKDISAYNQNDFSVTFENMQAADTVKIFRRKSLYEPESICEAISVKISVSEPVISATLSENGTLTVKGIISNEETTENNIMLGIYDENKLLECVDISNENQNKLSFKIENVQGADTVKLFCWSSLSSMMPLYGAVEVEVK